jgi:hypothetical protein
VRGQDGQRVTKNKILNTFFLIIIFIINDVIDFGRFILEFYSKYEFSAWLVDHKFLIILKIMNFYVEL